MISCSRCGAQLPDTMRFCTGCGNPMPASGVPVSPGAGQPPFTRPDAPAVAGTETEAEAPPVPESPDPSPMPAPAPDPAPRSASGPPLDPAPAYGPPYAAEPAQSGPQPYPAPAPGPWGAAQPGYPSAAQPGYPPAAQPGYPPAAQSGYPPAAQPGYPPAAQPGYPPAAQPGYPPIAQPGYPPAAQPGYSAAAQPGYPPAYQGAPQGPGPWQPPSGAGAGGADLLQAWSRYGGDWSRTAISVLLLLLSLGLIWNSRGAAADQVLVLIATLVALPAGFVDPLLQPAVVGRVFTSTQRLLFRVAFITPLVLLVCWAIVDHVINAAGFGPAPLTALAGAAVAVTGALSQADPGQARVWTLAAAVCALAGLVWGLVLAVQLVKAGFDVGSFGGGRTVWLSIIAALLTVLWLGYVAVRLGLRAVNSHPEAVSLGWWLAAVLGTWFLCVRLFTDGLGRGARSVVTLVPVSGLLAVAAALLTAAALRRALPQPPGHAWLNAASTGLFLIGTAAAVEVVQGLLLFADVSDKGLRVWLVLLAVVGAVGAFLTRSMLGRDPRRGRTPVLGYAVAFTVALWLTYLIASSVAVVTYSASDAVLFLGPLAVAVCLVAPASVRRLLGPLVVPQALRGTPMGAPGQPGASGPGPAGAPVQPFPGAQPGWGGAPAPVQPQQPWGQPAGGQPAPGPAAAPWAPPAPEGQPGHWGPPSAPPGWGTPGHEPPAPNGPGG